ncbi:hypothetical protein Mapa_002204 [Marchantia paleacea]|nr:hypothetical protein Mapa_002204 [Marchantia paleacea]
MALKGLPASKAMSMKYGNELRERSNVPSRSEATDLPCKFSVGQFSTVSNGKSVEVGDTFPMQWTSRNASDAHNSMSSEIFVADVTLDSLLAPRMSRTYAKQEEPAPYAPLSCFPCALRSLLHSQYSFYQQPERSTPSAHSAGIAPPSAGVYSNSQFHGCQCREVKTQAPGGHRKARR